MERLNNLNKYFLEKERSRLNKKTKEMNDGLPEMTVGVVMRGLVFCDIISVLVAGRDSFGMS